MHPSRRSALRQIGAAGAFLAANELFIETPVLAQAPWPTRRVTIVVPAPAGIGTDVVIRILAKYLGEAYDQPFIIDNRPGAGQVLGTSYVSRAEADGYTLLAGGSTSHSAKAFLANVPYDPIKDFVPIARVVAVPILVVTNARSPFKSIQEFVAFAKAHPGQLSYGSGNASGQIVMEAIKSQFSLEITHVPYKGTPQAVADLLGNQIQVVVADFTNVIANIWSGSLIGMGLPALSRSKLLPDVPTLDETIMPGFEAQPWGGLFGPAGLPSSITKQLSKSVGEILAKPDVIQQIRAVGLDPYYLPAESFGAYTASQVTRWTALAKNAGIVPQ